MKPCTASPKQRIGNIETGGFSGYMIQASAGDYVGSLIPITWLVLMRFIVGRQLCPREQGHHLFQGSPGNIAEPRLWGTRVVFHKRRADLRP